MNILLRTTVILISLSLNACFDDASAPSDAPANITATAGESLVVVDWDVKEGLTYWIFYDQGTTTDLEDYEGILMDVAPPYLVSGLVNGMQYAFAVTSSQDGSKVGPFSSVATATPRLLDPDVDWTVGASLTSNDFRSIVFGNNNYVTVGDAATVFVAPYSYADIGGVTGWTQVSSLPVTSTTDLRAVIYDGLRFLALGDDGAVIRSTDAEAQIWESATAITTPPVMNALAIGAGIYVAVGNNGAIYTNSNDAVEGGWVEQTSGTSNHLYGVSYVYDKFVAVGASGTLLTSTDGVVWSAQTSGTGSSLRYVAYGADTYVAVGDAGAVVSSVDASSWAVQTIPTAESFRAICFGPDDQFIAVGTTGTIAYSSTGADGSWAVTNAGSIDLNSIAPNLVFVATGAAGANVSGK